MWWNPKTELPVSVVAKHHLRCSARWVHELLARGELRGANYGYRKTVVFKDSLADYKARLAAEQTDKLGFPPADPEPETQPAPKKTQPRLF